MGIRTLFSQGRLKPWADVLDPSQDGKSAPSLWEVVQGLAPEIYKDPEEFFKRTHFTASLTSILEGIANRLRSKNEQESKAAPFILPNVIMLASRFGGGKTHTLITLYHAFSRPESLRHVNDRLALDLAQVRDVQVIPLDADSKKLVPHPLEPYNIENFRIATIWGMLAYRLGEYGKLRHLDSGEKPVPDTDSLKQLLRGKRVIILMDEIVKYVFNMQRSEETKNYGEKVITFIENLAKAVEDTDSVLIISVQADYRKGAETMSAISLMDFSPDTQYKDQAERIIQALRRVSPAIITPVSSDDIAQVLKKRIFEVIPEEAASQAQAEFYAVYREHQGLFGVEGRWDFATDTKIFSIKDTYPFHPKYIELLSEVVTRNKDLQRTRDAVNITRKVVRSLLRADTDPLAIMPAHINLKNREIRDNTITESYAREFDSIINKDIVTREGSLGNVTLCSKPEIATVVANTVLLKTFTYETFKEALHVFPDLTDVALMVYEPDLFIRNEATPIDMQDLLKEMPNRLDHFMSDKGRYWFSPYRSVKEIVDKMAESLVREDKPKLYRKMEEIARSVVKVSLSRAREYEPLVFKDVDPVFVGPGYDTVQDISVTDDEKMKLVVFIKQPVSEDEVENVILRAKSSRRLRVNTIAAVFPDPNKKLDDLLLFVAKIKAAEHIMENLKEYYADQDVRSLQQKKLSSYRDENRVHVIDGLLTTLTKVAFPTAGTFEPSIKVVGAQKASSLTEQVERALNSASAGFKIRERIEFSDLVGYLKSNFNMDIVEGEKPIDFRYVFDDLFLAKAEAPFVDRSQIEQALRQGLRTFDIGIKQDGKLYWKKVGSPEVDEPQSISDKAEILPYKLAAKEFLNTLMKDEGRKRTPEGHVVEVKYYLKVLDEERPLSVVSSQVGFERIIKENIILKKESRIEEGFDVILEKSYLTLKQGEPVKIKFSVETIGGFTDTVELLPDAGSIAPSKGKPSFSGIWNLGPFNKPGTYKHTLIGRAGKISRNFVLDIVVESEYKIVEKESLDHSLLGSLLVEIRPHTIPSFKIATDILDKFGLEGRASAKIRIDDKISFEITGAKPSLCSFLLQKFEEFRERFGSMLQKFEYLGTIEITTPFKLEQRSLTNLQVLNNKATFAVQIRR